MVNSKDEGRYLHPEEKQFTTWLLCDRNRHPAGYRRVPITHSQVKKRQKTKQYKQRLLMEVAQLGAMAQAGGIMQWRKLPRL